MDTLRDLAKRASRYCIDLGDRVDRDITEVVRGGSAFVYRGTLHPEGLAVAVKTFRFGHKSGVRVIPVLGRIEIFLIVYSIRAFFTKSSYGPSSATGMFFRYWGSLLNSIRLYPLCLYG